MALLKLEDKPMVRDLEKINDHLRSFTINLEYLKPDDSLECSAALIKANPSLKERNLLLKVHEHYFNYLKSSYGFKQQDLVVLYQGIPDLDSILDKFRQCHTHDDDEVRYFIEGNGIFGFANDLGQQALLFVEAGDFINIPAHTKHWFDLAENCRAKVIRYFNGDKGWVPNYVAVNPKISPSVFL